MGFLDGLSTSKNLHGNASFMPFWERVRFLNSLNKGLVIDGKNLIPLILAYMHLLLVAPTGAGKTTKYIIPNILRLTLASAVIFDPSGEIYRLCNKYLKRKGYNLKILNLSELSGSARFNPLARLRNIPDIMKMCDIIIAAAFPNATGADAYWNNSAKSIIALIIQVVLKFPKPKQNLKEVFRILNRIETKEEEVLKLMSEHLDQDGYEKFAAFIANEPKLKNSILATARTALNKLSDPDIAELVSTDTLDFESLRREKTAVFIMVEESEVDYYAFLLTILYTQLFNFCLKMPEEGKPYLPIFFFMDEFANSGKIPGFENLITVLRKRLVSLSLVIQDLRQLEALYGKPAAETIINNCASQIYYPGLSLETCERLERILGKATMLQDENKSGIGISKNSKELGRSLMTAQEIRTMEDMAIFIHGNKLPIKIYPLPWYKSIKLKSRTK